jgi:hypothetical protein
MSQKFCNNCGYKLPPNVKFCNQCGKPIKQISKTEAKPKETDFNDFINQLLQFVPEFTEKCKAGIDYLKKNGFYMYLQLPGPEELLKMFEESYRKGEIDFNRYSETKKSLEEAIKSGPSERKIAQLKPGFEPKDTLPRPYTMKSLDGRVIEISTAFLDRFELITEMDFRRMIRNSSILLTNFTGPIEQDNFKIHSQRLADWLDKNALDTPGGFKGLLEFTISLMILDNLLPSKRKLSNQDFYYASLILGALYRLFPIHGT